MDTIYNIGSKLRGSVMGTGQVSTTASSSSDDNILGGSALVRLGSEIGGVLGNTIETPCIAVVGTQSAGKSTVLNHIVGMDLLPTGEQMTTRLPLHIYLHNSSALNEESVELGEYIAGSWQSYLLVTGSATDELDKIRAKLGELSSKRAGGGISSDPLAIRVRSPRVAELKLIDLPGLVAVSCPKKGQPEDMPQRIKELIESHISSERTIILAVMAARPDIEADMAMSLVHRFDKEGKRTIGVLTKVDLVANAKAVVPYLQGKVDDLNLWGGYYAIKGRTPEEMATIGIADAVAREPEWFSKQSSIYSTAPQDRLGTRMLVTGLSRHLTQHIRRWLPAVIESVDNKLAECRSHIGAMGERVPEDAGAQWALLSRVVTSTISPVVDGLQGQLGVGIKAHVREYGAAIRGLEIVAPSEWSEERLATLSDQCNGYRMSLDVPSSWLLERILMPNRGERPLDRLLAPSNEFAETVLRSVIDSVLEGVDHIHWESLRVELRRIVEEVRNEWISETLMFIGQLIENECYIWTDNPTFFTSKQSPQQADNRSTMVGALVTKYIDIVKEATIHSVVKSVVNRCVSRISKLSEKVTEKLQQIGDPNDLFIETDVELIKRKRLESQILQLVRARELVATMLRTRA
jgi:dynamin 1-like protein